MGCLPESGGCERHRTDPFVAYLNKLEGAEFIHQACLDVLYRSSPQPEALYSDCSTGAEIVIERKTVVWPQDYAVHHQNDHLIADSLSEKLRDLAHGQPLTVHLDQAPRMRRTELSSFAHEVAESIRASMTSILEGNVIGSNLDGGRWSCCLDPEQRAAADEPATGLIIRWTYPDETPNTEQLPAELVDKVRGVFASTVIKFRNYAHARGILLLDPHGSIRYTGEWWWSGVFAVAPVPSSIADVWLAQYNWVTEHEQGWIFERIYKT
jgi:hypothetical protein